MNYKCRCGLCCVLILSLTAFGSISIAKADCVVLVGMSQTRDISDGLNKNGVRDFALQWRGGQEIDDFADGRAFSGMQTRYDFCQGRPEDRENVIIQLSAPTQSAARIEELTEQAVANVRSRYRNARNITVATQLGGPSGRKCPVRSNMQNTRQCVREGGTCYVRDSYAFEQGEWVGMQRYAERTPGVSFYAATVTNCNDFSDGKGHLTPSGDRNVANKWVSDGLLDGSSGGGGPAPDPDPTPTTCPVAPLPGQTLFRACYSHYGYTKPFTGSEKTVIKACVASCENGAPPPAPDPEPEPEPTPDGCPVLAPEQTIFNGCYNYYGYTKPFTGAEKTVIKACVASCENGGPPPAPEPDPEPTPGDCPIVRIPDETAYHSCYTQLGYSKPFSSQERREVKACTALCE